MEIEKGGRDDIRVKSNPRGDTQIASGLSVSLSTLSGGIFLLSGFQPLLGPPHPRGAAFVVSITHFLDAYYLPVPDHSLTTLGDKSCGGREGSASLLHDPSSPLPGHCRPDTFLQRPGERALLCVGREERGR